jgi:voltage-gated potassium channel Kch
MGAWRRHGYLIVTAVGVATAVLGAVGTIQYLHAVGRYQITLLDLAYYVAELFVLEAGLDTPNPVPWPLAVARVVAPAVTSYALIAALASMFGDKLMSIRLRFLRGHVIVCGLGRLGAELVRGYRGRRERVVVIEPDRAHPAIPTCKELGAIVLLGNPADESLLRRARIAYARLVLAVSFQDSTNVQTAFCTRSLVVSRSSTKIVKLFVRLLDIRLAELVEQHQLLAAKDDRLDVRVLRPADMAARRLFDDHPLDHRSIRAGSDARVHLVIAGFGHVGQGVALQAARIGHFANHQPVRITVVDRNPDRAAMAFRAMFPSFDEVVRLDLAAIEIESPGFFEKVAAWAAEPGVLLTVALCMSDATVSLASALSIATRTKEARFPIHVRLDSEEQVGGLLTGSPAIAAVGPDIDAFGQPSRFCTPEAVENEVLDVLARRIHEHFRQRAVAAGQRPEGDPSLAAWEDLEPSLRDSNRQQADHIAVKLRAVGCEAAKPDPARSAQRLTAFAEEEVATLARMEHARLVAERKLAGWKYGPEKDVPNKISPQLVAWNELPADMKATHLDAVKNIPALLDGIGRWVYRA